MPIYTVDIACRSTGHDYAALFQALRNANGLMFMEGRWLLDLRDDVTQATNALLSHCAPGDGVFVTELAPETRWTGTGLGDEAKAWIAARSVPRKPPQQQAQQPTVNCRPTASPGQPPPA